MYSKDVFEYRPCSWNGNWLLNVVASEDCRNNGHKGGGDCDVSADLYRTLDTMSRRKDTFSVMGFVSKFFKVCGRLDKMRVRVVVKKKRSSTQTPNRVKVISSANDDDGGGGHSYSVHKMRPNLSRTRIGYANGDDAEILTETSTVFPPPTTTTTLTTAVPTTPRRRVPPTTTQPPSKAASSYVDRYLNQMDELGNAEMVRYRLGVMFKDLKEADRERPRSTSVSASATRCGSYFPRL